MAERINSYCTVCGKGYHLCVSCGSHKLTPWRVVTDTSEHYKIHQILSAVSCGVYSEEEAKERLMNVDLSDIDTYKDSVKNNIYNIINADYYKSTIEKTVDAPIDNVTVAGNTIVDDEPPKKSTKKKKSNQIVETE